MTTGDRIKFARKRIGVTQKELAEKIGCKSKSSIAHYESNRTVSLETVEKIAKALNTTPAYIMGWEEYSDTKKDAPTNEGESKTIKEIMEKISQLSDSDIIQLDNFVSFLVAQSKAKAED